jgi:hypothetical protein
VSDPVASRDVLIDQIKGLVEIGREDVALFAINEFQQKFGQRGHVPPEADAPELLPRLGAGVRNPPNGGPAN